jgi:LCP family protein required for cell wall assembly
MSVSMTPSGRARIPGAPSDDRASGRASIPTATGGYRGSAYPAAPQVGSRPGGGGGGRPPYGPPQKAYRGKRRPRWGRIALVLGGVLVLILGGFGLFGFFYAHHLDASVARTDPFSGITGQRPAHTVDGAMNILILGSDSRNPDSTTDSRTDTIILMHVDADHKHAYLISIPRDSYVYIPKSPTNPKQGDTKDKINAAYSWGGATLTVETVERLTNVRIDHLVLIDFSGFQQVTDALGGVDMYVDKTITSIHPPHRVFKKGNRHFTGAEALDYVRQRYQFADGDLTREKHQQAFMKAIMDKAASSGTVTDLGRLNAFLKSVAKAITVDNDFDILNTMIDFRSLRSKDLTFMTTPITGFGTERGQSVVELSPTKDAALFKAVNEDKVAAYVASTKSGSGG